MDIINTIESIYDRGELAYLLSRYTDRNFWTEKLKAIFVDKQIDNLTDFNYNKCFTMHINLSDTNVSIGTQEFDKYVASNQVLYRMVVEISALVPYCIVKYLKYNVEANVIKCECCNVPYLQEHLEYDNNIRKFVADFRLTLLDDKTLTTLVPNKSLELKEAPVSAYNCLFQDSYSYFPYSEHS